MGLENRGTTLIRNSPTLGPYSRTTPRAFCWSYGGWVFLMSEVPLYLEGGWQRVFATPCHCSH